MNTLTGTRPAEVARIGAIRDPVLRNLLITQSYHELSLGLRQRVGGGANWCTFATWASRQAGCTIRGEDLRQALRARLHDAGIAERLARSAAQHVDSAIPARTMIDVVMRTLDADGALDRASAAVAEGNLKVFAEIGREFARFLEAEDVDTFLAALSTGDPPHGQALLREAFAAYRAVDAADAALKPQLAHYANLLIGLHEQTRLQPDIARAMNATFDASVVRERIIVSLLPGGWRRIRRRAAALFGRRPPLDEAVDAILARVQRELRELITTQAMTLRLGSRTVRLGKHVDAAHAAGLRNLTEPRLIELLARLDPDPRSTTGSGAQDWSVLEQRMHLIADLFRCSHDWPQLHDAPFTHAQVAAMRAGRVPTGDL